MRKKPFGKFGNDKSMKTLFGSIYKGKKVFVTGHTGFKGSWLCLWLSELGAKVTGYSLGFPTSPSHFKLLNLGIDSIVGDILDKNKLLTAIKKVKPEIVFHLAAQPIVRLSYQNPVETLETNIMGTVNLLESCRQIPTIKAVLVITSDKCYQNREIKRGYRENDPMGGDDPYSASKGCAELISNAYRKSFFKTALLANIRAGNVIGGGDWALDRLIPDIMKAANQGEIVKIRNPLATRPWQHVLEPLSGYLHLGQKLLQGKKAFADNWNFGPKKESNLSVGQVIKETQKYWGAIKYQIKGNKDNWHEANLLMLNSTKANKELKWKAVWNSRETFRKTVLWYKNYYENNKILSTNDLNEYVNDSKHASIEWAVR